MEALRYNRYHPSLIYCYATGREHLVPDHVRRRVPHSTASGWRRVDATSLIGHEVWDVQRETFDLHELLLRYHRLRTTIRVLVKVWTGIADVLLPVLKHKAHGERVVNALQLLYTVMPRHRALKLVNLSSSAFHERVARLKARCGISPAARCFQRHPLQLSLREVGLIKALFADPALACWPASSLYYEGLRNRGLQIALSTFYNYAALLGLKRKRRKETPKTQGIRATAPNEYLHVDTTFWGLDHGLKAAIVLVSDNFSKAILGWHIALGKHAVNVVEALRQAIATIHRHHPGQVNANLVADAGGENHADCIEALLDATKDPIITKLIAQRDIRFSNSPIEAINKILKQYLRHYNPRTPAALKKVVVHFVQDYGSVRPHGTLNGLIPMEAYIHPDVKPHFRKAVQEARFLRLEENKKVNCGICRTS